MVCASGIALEAMKEPVEEEELSAGLIDPYSEIEANIAGGFQFPEELELTRVLLRELGVL